MNIYFITRNDDPKGLIKIGFAGDVNARLQGLRCAIPEGISVLAVMPGSQAQERALHKQLREYCFAGEWFEPHPSVIAVVDEAAAKGCEISVALKKARETGRPAPHYLTLTNEHPAVEIAISCLNELVLRELRGQGDTQTGARSRVADRLGVRRTLCKRLWDRWRSMRDVPASLLIALAVPVADLAEAEGNLPAGLGIWTTANREWMAAHMRRAEAEQPVVRRFPERDNEEETT